MSRAGHQPTRTCTGCGRARCKRELLRVVRTKSGEVVPDPSGRRPGRGAYVCFDIRCVALTNKKNGLHRSLRIAVSPQAWDAIEDAVITKLGDQMLKRQSSPASGELSRDVAAGV